MCDVLSAGGAPVCVSLEHGAFSTIYKVPALPNETTFRFILNNEGAEGKVTAYITQDPDGLQGWSAWDGLDANEFIWGGQDHRANAAGSTDGPSQRVFMLAPGDCATTFKSKERTCYSSNCAEFSSTCRSDGEPFFVRLRCEGTWSNLISEYSDCRASIAFDYGCGPGSYGNFNGTDRPDNCTSCPNNTYLAKMLVPGWISSAQDCLPCPPGLITDGAERSSCRRVSRNGLTVSGSGALQMILDHGLVIDSVPAAAA